VDVATGRYVRAALAEGRSHACARGSHVGRVFGPGEAGRAGGAGGAGRRGGRAGRAGAPAAGRAATSPSEQAGVGPRELGKKSDGRAQRASSNRHPFDRVGDPAGRPRLAADSHCRSADL
jgi:hypothetical protein